MILLSDIDRQDHPVLQNLIKVIIRLARSTDCGEINNLYVIACDLLADLATCSLCDAAKEIAERSKKGSDRDDNRRIQTSNGSD